MNFVSTFPKFRGGDQVVWIVALNRAASMYFYGCAKMRDDITERNSNMRSHPVEWLVHSNVGAESRLGRLRRVEAVAVIPLVPGHAEILLDTLYHGS